MKTHIKVMIQFFLVILLALPCFAATLKPPTKDYSADFSMTVTQGQGAVMTIPGRIYYSKGMERRETEIMGHKSISIRRDDKNIFWTLIPGQRMYMEHSLEDELQDSDPAAIIHEDDIAMTRLGREKINGVMTDKYRMMVDNGQKQAMDGFIWLSKENVPIRVEGTSQEEGETGHFVLNTTNLRFARQPRSLFEIPAGYQQMQLPVFGGGGFSPGKSTLQPDAPSPGKSGMDISPEQLEQFRLQMEQMKRQMGVE